MVPAEHLEMPSPCARASLLSRVLWLSFALQVSLGVNFHIKFWPKGTEGDSHMMHPSFLRKAPLIFSLWLLKWICSLNHNTHVLTTKSKAPGGQVLPQSRTWDKDLGVYLGNDPKKHGEQVRRWDREWRRDSRRSIDAISAVGLRSLGGGGQGGLNSP